MVGQNSPIVQIIIIKPIVPGPITHTTNTMCLTLKFMLNYNMCITTDTLVMIILHKKADLKVNCTRDRKVHVDKNNFDLGKNGYHRAGGLSVRSIVVFSE